MKELSVDIIGSLPATTRRYSYLLVVIYKFTKFIELFPLQSTMSKNVVGCMLEVFRRRGMVYQYLFLATTQAIC